jgi:AAA+ superfamily predicted ATPase
MEFIVEKHPNAFYKQKYDQLVGVECQKKELLDNLELILCKDKVSQWIRNHANSDLWGISFLKTISPLIILHGEVGCGKTELANSIATELSKEINCKEINTINSPGNLRGSGLVGEISNKIVSVFEKTKDHVKKTNIPTLLVFDEADDIATSRSQNQAHHEDRAGLNTLIKEIDKVSKANLPIAVILITNRLNVLDPAIRRRSLSDINFQRPENQNLKSFLSTVLKGIKHSENDFNEILNYMGQKKMPYSYSDIVVRVYKPVVLKALKNNKSVDIVDFKSQLKTVEPTPLLVD